MSRTPFYVREYTSAVLFFASPSHANHKAVCGTSVYVYSYVTEGF